ncbi:rCG63157 [Rattus norvegicus]|uniref:RCG63157 n=1 Tax=Rattus norvegicus TaxID=10116 RepID=A6K0G2_RAT|nr:rCG63157 [Rattus norvegicus]
MLTFGKSCFATQAGFPSKILLPQSLECGDYRWVPPFPAFQFVFYCNKIPAIEKLTREDVDFGSVSWRLGSSGCHFWWGPYRMSHCGGFQEDVQTCMEETAWEVP